MQYGGGQRRRLSPVDELCAWGLRALIRNHPNDFGNTDLGGVADAKKMRAEEKQQTENGREAAKLHARWDYLDGKERERLLTLVEGGKDSPAFSAELMQNVSYNGRDGQEGLLLLADSLESRTWTVWGQVATSSTVAGLELREFGPGGHSCSPSCSLLLTRIRILRECSAGRPFTVRMAPVGRVGAARSGGRGAEGRRCGLMLRLGLLVRVRVRRLVRVRGCTRGRPAAARAHGRDGNRCTDEGGCADAESDPEAGVALVVRRRHSGWLVVVLRTPRCLGGLGGGSGGLSGREVRERVYVGGAGVAGSLQGDPRADGPIAHVVVALGAIGWATGCVEHDPQDLIVGPVGMFGPDQGGGGGGEGRGIAGAV
jgi:hypothetical protein